MEYASGGELFEYIVKNTKYLYIIYKKGLMKKNRVDIFNKWLLELNISMYLEFLIEI